MNALQTFTFAGTQQIRTVIEDGQVKFVSVDACNALGITNNRDAIASLEEDEKGVAIADTPGGKQTLVVITESGLYTLIFKSRKPEAQAFRKWVTSEVLPALRTTGTYTVAPQQPHLPQNYLEALKALVTTTEQAEALKLTVAAQHLKNGYFAVKAGENNDHAYTQTRFTAKGIEWLRRQLFPVPFALVAA